MTLTECDPARPSFPCPKCGYTGEGVARQFPLIKTSSESLPAGLSFADHSSAVLAAVAELIERAEGYQALRAQDGRRPSAERRAEWVELHGRLTALLERTMPPAPAPSVRLRQLALRARLVALGGPTQEH